MILEKISRDEVKEYIWSKLIFSKWPKDKIWKHLERRYPTVSIVLLCNIMDEVTAKPKEVLSVPVLNYWVAVWDMDLPIVLDKNVQLVITPVDVPTRPRAFKLIVTDAVLKEVADLFSIDGVSSQASNDHIFQLEDSGLFVRKCQDKLYWYKFRVEVDMVQAYANSENKPKRRP